MIYKMQKQLLPSSRVAGILSINIWCDNHWVDFASSKVCDDKDLALAFVNKELLRWMRSHVEKFVNQREFALGEVNMFHMSQYIAVKAIRGAVTNCTTYEGICRRILLNQDDIRLLYPSPHSRHHSWVAIMNCIIQHCHDELEKAQAQGIQQREHPPVSGSASLPT
jgi:hypothetical protein